MQASDFWLLSSSEAVEATPPSSTSRHFASRQSFVEERSWRIQTQKQEGDHDADAADSVSVAIKDQDPTKTR